MTKLIKELRELTGAGMMEIKQALEEAGQDKNKAIEILRKKGVAKLSKKAERVAKEGVVEAYIHPGSRVGVLIELNCETDFVARTADFKTLAKDLCLHIAAANPLYIDINDVPNELVEKEKEIYKEQSASGGKGKTGDIINKMVEGKLIKYYEEICLLEQPFAKNPDIKVKDLLAEAVGKIGENIQIRRFARFVLGN
jgi:elongation factor Ts